MSSADRPGAIAVSANWLRTRPRRYGFALLAVAAALAGRYGLEILFGVRQQFVLLYPAILLVALLAGFRPGVVATMLAALARWYLSLESANYLGLRDAVSFADPMVFAIFGVAISKLADVFRQRANRLQEFERVVEGLEEMIVVVDRDCRYLIANRAFLGYRGMKREDVVGRRVEEVLDAGVLETTIKANLEECFRGRFVQYEMRYKYPNRGERDLIISYFPIQGRDGVDRVACVLQDVTDQKQAGHSLKLFRALIEQSNDAIEVIDPNTMRFLDVNEKACQDLGYTREELLGMTAYEIDSNGDPSYQAAFMEKLRAEGFIVTESLHRRKDGSVFPVEASVKHVQLDNSYLVTVARDITDRKKSEAALRESEDRYRDLVEHTEDLLCTHNLEGSLLTVNAAAARILGYTVQELLQIPMRELVIPEGRPLFDAYLERVRTTGGPEKGLLCVITRSGEVRTWEYSNTLRTDGLAQPIVRGMAHDVTERRRAELAQQASEQRYKTLFERTVSGVGIISTEGVVIDCNDAWARMLGHNSAADCRGVWMADRYRDPKQREYLLAELRRDGVFLNREWELKRKDGSPLWVLLNSVLLPQAKGEPLIQSTMVDITERKRAEEERREAQRRLEDLVSTVEGIVWEAEAGTLQFTFVSQKAEQILGYPIDDWKRPGFWADHLHEEDRGWAVQFCQQAAREGRTHDFEYRMISADSRTVWIRDIVSVVDAGEEGKRLRGIMVDITRHKHTEELVRQSEERFRVALKDSPITVFNQDLDLRYTWIYNPQLSWQQDVLGKTDDEIIGAKKTTALNNLKRKVLATGIAAREEVAIPKNGTSSVFDITVEPLFDSQKNLIGITAACMDVALLREMADRLQESRDRLAHEKSYLQREIQTELGFEEIIGQSAALREVLKKARVVAPTDSTVLLLGETGTGKELVARSIHELSSRRAHTFVKLNCAAVPSGLLESELFGHEKGAFTSAVSQKIGRMELADKGTLFLDEIGELPPELQPKLLRVLQDREFERLGGIKTLRIDVRIIAATNRDLRQEVADKKFREDLFYRLNVFPIELPPLRERRDDIAMLVQHFVRKHAARMGKPIESVPEGTMRILRNWNWPGNVRELENMIERMVILTRGTILAAPPAELSETEHTPEDNLTEIEREHILRVLRETNGVLSGNGGAASRLGLKRTTLQSMIKRLGIHAHEYRNAGATGTFGR